MSLDRLQRITVEPGKCGGRPCIRGLRIRVSDLDNLAIIGILERGAEFRAAKG
ncbi:MAG TPA: DUF433 domain-containing protein [Candidatus Acidoferrum sp.]|nr:DUF433 domain-containing protein [Candidatus Acidoferrum sp.]